MRAAEQMATKRNCRLKRSPTRHGGQRVSLARCPFRAARAVITNQVRARLYLAPATCRSRAVVGERRVNRHWTVECPLPGHGTLQRVEPAPASGAGYF
jgi:hypothetical protein